MYNKHMEGVDILDHAGWLVDRQKTFHYVLETLEAYCTNFILYNNNCPIPIWIYVNFILRDLILDYLQKFQISTGLWYFQGKSKRTVWTVPGDQKTACTHCVGCQVGVHLKCLELITWTQHQFTPPPLQDFQNFCTPPGNIAISNWSGQRSSFVH